MPDLTVQLRRYAEYALDAVGSVDSSEIAGRGRPRPGARRPRRVARLVAWAIAAAAVVIGLVVLESVDSSKTRGVDVVTQPPLPTPTPTAATTPAPGPPASTVRASGIAGVRRAVAGGVAIRAVTITGETLWVTLPEDLPGVEVLSLVPDANVGIQSPTTPRSFLSALGARDVVMGICTGVPRCGSARIEAERRLPNGAHYTRWDLGLSNDRTVTVAMGRWTLVLEGPDVAAAETIAASLQWTVDPEGYLVLLSTDAVVGLRESGVMLLSGTSGDPADGVRIHVVPGCDGDRETNRPALGPRLERFGTTRPGSPGPAPERPTYGGRWCAPEGYGVEVVTGDQSVVDRLFASLRVSPMP